MSISPTVVTQMLIRRPAHEVFQAFIDPATTTHFWFTKSSGALVAGSSITWEWEMYGASAEVAVKKIIEDEVIKFTWGEPQSNVSISFEPVTADTTYVIIENYGFSQTGDELIRAINDSTGGFTTVLDGLKAWLEHGIELNLIADKFLKK